MIFLDNLPIDVIELINSNLNNINDKFKLKQISKFFNSTIFIDYNFENKFKLFCEENSYDYSEIDFKTLQLFDKNLNKNIIKIKFNNNLFKFDIKFIMFDFMLPFSNMYKSSFKIYSKEYPKNWFWYHNKVTICH